MTKPLTQRQVNKIINAFLAELPDGISKYVIDMPYGKALAHPFCRVMHLLLSITHLNETPQTLMNTVTGRERLYHEYCEKGEFEAALDGVDIAYRAGYLLELICEYGVEPLYSSICSVWQSVEGIGRDSEIWQDIWDAVVDGDGDQNSVMDAEDRLIFDAMPETLTIYRGFSFEGAGYGWSWTLDRNVAEWFARRYTGKPQVAVASVSKHVVLAYIGGRNESEIVIHPDQAVENVITEVLDVLEISEAA